MPTVLTSNVKNKEQFLAATLLYAGTVDSCTWILGNNIRVKVTSLELLAKNEQERVLVSVDVFGPANNKIGSLTKDYPAESVREQWRVISPADDRKKKVLDMAAQAADELRRLYEPADQVTWLQVRAAVNKAYEQFGDPLGPLARRGSVTNVGGRLTCRCQTALTVPERMCDHIAHKFFLGKDNGILRLCFATGTTILPVKVPLGFGYYWASVKVGRAIDDETNKDAPFLLAASYLEDKLLDGMGIAPVQQSPYLFAETEGLIGYVMYLEDIVLSTGVYETLRSMSPNEIISNSGCKNYHREPAIKMINKHASIRNPYRDAWILACAAALIETGSCLGCKMVGVGVSDVPNVD